MSSVPMPSAELIRRPFHFFWIVDNSPSMPSSMLAAFNKAIREFIPLTMGIAEANPYAEMLMRAISFSTDAVWHVGPAPIPIERFVWPDVSPTECSAIQNTVTSHVESLTAAIAFLSTELTTARLPQRGVPPLCVLVTGCNRICNYGGDFDEAIDHLLSLPWGKKALRIVIAATASSANCLDSLSRFSSHERNGVFQADTPDMLVERIKLACSTAVQLAIGVRRQQFKTL